MKTQLKLTLTAAAIAIAMTFAPIAAAQNDGSKFFGLLLAGGVGCAGGIAVAAANEKTRSSCGIVGGRTVCSARKTESNRTAACGIGSAATGLLYLLITSGDGNNAVPDSRWYLDGNDGMPKAVYPLSDAAKLSFGAGGEALDYDGIAIGVNYSF